MALPQTACLALPGPYGPVPGTSAGRAWYLEKDEEQDPAVRFKTCALPVAVSCAVSAAGLCVCGTQPVLMQGHSPC